MKHLIMITSVLLGIVIGIQLALFSTSLIYKPMTIAQDTPLSNVGVSLSCFEPQCEITPRHHQLQPARGL